MISSSQTVLYYDLDQTLFEIYAEDNAPSNLSSSALIDLSSSPEGVIANPLMVNDGGCQRRAKEIKAFARAKFQAHFEHIRDVNAGLERPLILVRIITNSNYTEPEVHALLQTFYGVDINFDGFANGDRQTHTKGDEMERDYVSLYQTLGIPRNNIYLIDDSEDNCSAAEEYGFQAIRMGTTPKVRGKTTYTVQKEQIFKSLSQIVDDAAAKVNGNKARISQP